MKKLGYLMAAGTIAGMGCHEHRIQDGDFEEFTQEVGEECRVDDHCVVDAVCFEQTCVGDGLLRVSLAWDKRTDLDLHVLTPSGEEIFFSDPWHETGELDVDDCVGACRTWSGPHVENVFFNDLAESGEYQVWVVNYDGRRKSDYRIEVVGPDLRDSFWGTLAGPGGNRTETFRFELD